jgi:hypothetical protein
MNLGLFHEMDRRRTKPLSLFFCAVLLGHSVAVGQLGTVPGFNTSSAPNDATRSVSGRVVNAVTGQPIARALVQANGIQAMLTDSEGKFELDKVPANLSSVYLQTTKPGFNSGPSSNYGNAGQQVSLDRLDRPIELRLYPEALLTGTVTAPSGDRLPMINVVAMRRFFDFGRRWSPVGQAVTDSHGNFRLPLAPGDYVVQIPYVEKPQGMTEAILPLRFPAEGSSLLSSVLHLSSGTEQHLDLHPETRPTHHVRLRIESATEHAYPQIEARTSNGSTMYLSPAASPETPGEFRVELPSGSYALSASITGPNGQEHAETAVTVADHDVSGILLRFTPLSVVPIELVVDAASTDSAHSDSAIPDVPQLGIMLENSDPGTLGGLQVFTASSERGQPPAFRLPPGTYQLRGQQLFSHWYVRSISQGTTNLLIQPLVIGPGGSSEPIQVVASNQTSALKVSLKLNGKPVGGEVCLISTSPSATPLLKAPMTPDGTLNWPYLPPGSYLAVGFESGANVDLLDPEVQATFSSHTKSITLTPGEALNLDLDAVPESELQP